MNDQIDDVDFRNLWLSKITKLVLPGGGFGRGVSWLHLIFKFDFLFQFDRGSSDALSLFSSESFGLPLIKGYYFELVILFDIILTVFQY